MSLYKNNNYSGLLFSFIQKRNNVTNTTFLSVKNSCNEISEPYQTSNKNPLSNRQLIFLFQIFMNKFKRDQVLNELSYDKLLQFANFLKTTKSPLINSSPQKPEIYMLVYVRLNKCEIALNRLSEILWIMDFKKGMESETLIKESFLKYMDEYKVFYAEVDKFYESVGTPELSPSFPYKKRNKNLRFKTLPPKRLR